MFLKLGKNDKNGQNLKFWMFSSKFEMIIKQGTCPLNRGVGGRLILL